MREGENEESERNKQNRKVEGERDGRRERDGVTGRVKGGKKQGERKRER